VPRPFPLVHPPPLAEQDGRSFPSLVALVRRLLAPDGCPWDREQDYGSLRRHFVEEACEVADAIDAGDLEALEQELGDVAMHVVFLAELGRRDGAFGPDDVIAAVVRKLVRRHPHVFGEAEVDGSAQVLQNWERIKADERQRRGKGEGVLAGVPGSLSALTRAQRTGEKVAHVGFDWPDATGPRAKIDEELGELDQAIAQGDRERAAEELGDLLHAVVNLARHLEVDAEASLRRAMDRFAERFAAVEQRVERQGGWFPGGAARDIDELEQLWQAAKDGEQDR